MFAGSAVLCPAAVERLALTRRVPCVGAAQRLANTRSAWDGSVAHEVGTAPIDQTNCGFDALDRRFPNSKVSPAITWSRHLVRPGESAGYSMVRAPRAGYSIPPLKPRQLSVANLFMRKTLRREGGLAGSCRLCRVVSEGTLVP